MNRLIYIFLCCLTLFYSSEVFAKALFIVGPSGVGKSTSIQRIVQESNGKIKNGISHTTRVPCHNEKDGRDYYFISQEQFDRMKANNEFIISTETFKQSYGLSYQEIEQVGKQDEIFISAIDGQSIELLKEKLGKDCFFIFLAPSSYEVLERRLKSQCLERESQKDLEKCLTDAVKVLSYEPLCDLTVIANELDETVTKIQAVIKTLKSDESILLENVNVKNIDMKKLNKYNTSEIVRYKFTQEGLEGLKKLYHKVPINSLIMDLYNFKEGSINVKLHKNFKNLVAWDEEKRFFIEPTPIYGEVERFNSHNLPYLKYSENGVHLELWVTYASLLKNSNLEYFWFGSNFSQEKNQTTFQEIENFENPYLVSLLDLELRDLPLLKSIKEEVYKHLIKLYNVGKNDDVQLFFHFPYAPKTATLHLHIRVNQKIHPLELAKSISLDKVIEGFERHQSIQEIIFEQQELYQGYIYSDAATLELPQQISCIVIEKVDNIFQFKKSGTGTCAGTH